MALILGIDPGSRHTGYGLVEHVGNRSRAVAFGTISTSHKEMPPRLGEIFAGIDQVVKEYGPAEVGIEKVFMARNADSALKLGQARGSAIVAAVNADLPVHEYAARLIKQAVTGNGGADKSMVQNMVMSMLKLPARPQADAADALGVAITHANTNKTLIALAGKATGARKGRYRGG